MGYTHYWSRPIEIEPEVFDAICRELVPLLHEQTPRHTLWTVTSDLIRIEGGCETFWFPLVESDVWDFVSPELQGPDEAWRFCKTRRLPYDALVVLALKVAKRHLGDRLRLESDGGPEVFAEAGQPY